MRKPGIADLACSSPFKSYGTPRGELFPDLLVCQQLVKANLLHEMANSFLFFATVDATSETRKTLLSSSFRGEVAWYYSVRDKFSTETVFHHVRKNDVEKI